MNTTPYTGKVSGMKTSPFDARTTERFLSNVDRNGPLPDQSIPSYTGLGPCHIWKRSLNKTGYAQFHANGRQNNAHRAAWEIANDDFADEDFVLHRCDNRACVNPDHLTLGSHKDNMREMRERRRAATGAAHYSRTKPECVLRGERNGRAVLTADDVRVIRSDFANGLASQRQLANKYGMAKITINRIIRRALWKSEL